HGVQASTQGFPDCGGTGCWIYESHANWMPHQIYRDDVHCSDMLVNAPHLYYGSTRNRYCNWQFFEFLKDKHCYEAVNEMWTYDAPAGQRDPWQKLLLSQGWDIEQLNDLFGEWAMHNVTWDYRDPPPTGSDGSGGRDQGDVYRTSYGSIEDTQGRTDRRLRLTRLESLDDDWTETRRFVSPYHWAPQRWGYNVVRLHPEEGARALRLALGPRGDEPGAHGGALQPAASRQRGRAALLRHPRGAPLPRRGRDPHRVPEDRLVEPERRHPLSRDPSLPVPGAA